MTIAIALVIPVPNKKKQEWLTFLAKIAASILSSSDDLARARQRGW